MTHRKTSGCSSFPVFSVHGHECFHMHHVYKLYGTPASTLWGVVREREREREGGWKRERWMGEIEREGGARERERSGWVKKKRWVGEIERRVGGREREEWVSK